MISNFFMIVLLGFGRVGRVGRVVYLDGSLSGAHFQLVAQSLPGTLRSDLKPKTGSRGSLR